MKVCNRCNINTDNFRTCRYKTGIEYQKAICRACESKSSSNWNKNHPAAIKKNKSNIGFNEYSKQWKKDNRAKINAQYRDRIKNDPTFRLRKNCSRAISRMLKSNNSSKCGKSILQYLPYTIKQLKSHIEKQFDTTTNWANYGISWEIDHIVPQSDLPYKTMNDINFAKCWALENLRPYNIKLNRSEGASRIRHTR